MSWLHTAATISIAVALVCLVIIVIDIWSGHRQNMMIMNFVWPITALYAGPLALWAYYTIGRRSLQGATQDGPEKPFWQMVLVGALHCGSGCTLGDLVAEWAVVAVPLTLFGRKVFGTWALDFALAFLFGIAFQYFSIKPMRNLSPFEGLWAAVKADTLSLLSWQVGMYGWMAIVVFVIFKHELPKTDPLFWFNMQIAMLAGLVTAFPVNWVLIKVGIKERM